MHINILDNDHNYPFPYLISSVFAEVSLSSYHCSLVWESVGETIPEQNYSQASRLFFAFSVSGWRVQQRKCEVTKKKKKKRVQEKRQERRETVSMF